MANPQFTNAGANIANQYVTGTGSPTVPKYIGIGSSSLASPAKTSTALQTEYTTGTFTGYARQATSQSVATTTNTNDTAVWTGTFTAPSAVSPSEAGNFDATTVGNMFIYGSFTAVPLATRDTLTITIKWQLS